MTATDELRRMLDERGVEWGNIRNDGSESDYLTEWQFENNQGKAIAIEWAVGSGLSVEIHRYHLTPAQAIAATLGSCNCSFNCTNSERTGAPRLPHFWTHDGVLHIEATRMPTRIVVCEGGTCEFVPKRELDASEYENAKLRELVRDMYGFIERMDEDCGDVTFSDCFDYCKHDTADDGCCKTGECWYEQSMRELGVEVDG